jgi:6-phosphogluconolactonase (cycloisomerase 2 family)
MNFAFRASSYVFLPASLLAFSHQAYADFAGTENAATGQLGVVTTQTNASDGNELVTFARAADGVLTPAGHFDTGGTGLGAGLTSQGSIARKGRWLFVVNAGSSDVTTFDLAAGSPVAVARTASGGTEPVSVTAQADLVYVLNAGGSGNIAGFRVDDRGVLHAIAGSTQPVSGDAVTPTDISFTRDGDMLVVTERDGNNIDVYHVDVAGRAQPPVINASDGPKPFGFGFTPSGELVVSEAADSAASAYAISEQGRLASITASILNTQQAACWLVVAEDGRYAFTANAGSGTLSSYDIGPEGQLSLDSAIAGVTGAGSHPVDMAFAAEGRFLYSLANVAGTITTFAVQGGALSPVGTVGSLPESAAGLVAW